MKQGVKITDKTRQALIDALRVHGVAQHAAYAVGNVSVSTAVKIAKEEDIPLIRGKKTRSLDNVRISREDRERIDQALLAGVRRNMSKPEFKAGLVLLLKNVRQRNISRPEFRLGLSALLKKFEP